MFGKLLIRLTNRKDKLSKKPNKDLSLKLIELGGFPILLDTITLSGLASFSWTKRSSAWESSRFSRV